MILCRHHRNRSTHMNAPTSATLEDTTALSTNETTYVGTAARILEMLGNGLQPEIVATASGVSPAYVSQLLSEESFSRQVTEKRFLNLQAATTRDRSYDSLEDKLLEKMEDLLPLMYKPMEVLRAISIINTAKRRGSGVPESQVINNTIVQLQLPDIILNHFVKNETNQVIATGNQQLITIGAEKLTEKLSAHKLGVLNELTDKSEVTEKAT